MKYRNKRGGERQLDISFSISFLKDFIYLFLERGEGKDKERILKSAKEKQ